SRARAPERRRAARDLLAGHHPLKRVRRRSSERGAALMEAVVTIPFFVTMFVMTIFTGNFYRAKLHTIEETKQAALTTASSSCGGTGISVQKMDGADVAFGIATNLLMGAPWTDIFTKGFLKVVDIKEGSVTSGATYDKGPFTIKITTKTSI